MGDRGRTAVADDDQHGAYALKLITVNVTGWSNAQRFLVTVDASVSAVCLQETWLDATKGDAAHAWAAKRGWQLALSPAERTTAGGVGGGAAVCVRACCGMRYLEGATSVDVASARVAAAIVEVPLFPAGACFSAYPRTAEQLSETNRSLLTTIGTAVAGQAAPAIIGGDMSMSPEVLSSPGFAERAKLELVADDGPTYVAASGSAVLEYVAVQTRLAQAVACVQRDQESCVPSPMPVLLGVYPNVAALKELRLYQLPPMCTAAAFGPRNRPPCWKQATEASTDFSRGHCSQRSPEASGRTPPGGL